MVIVESPTKAATIGKYLGDAYIVMSSVGVAWGAERNQRKRTATLYGRARAKNAGRRGRAASDLSFMHSRFKCSILTFEQRLNNSCSVGAGKIYIR